MSISKQAEVRPSLSGSVYLEWLLTNAAIRIMREGSARDEDQLQRGEAAVERLLATAAGLSLSTGLNMPLGLFFGAEYAVRRRISARDLRMALRELCPIWPFCKTKR